MQTKYIALLLCLGAALPATANELGADWIAVPEQELEQLRGGLDLGKGLLVSLGVERLVSINGNVLASSNFTIADVSKLSVSEARLASEALASVNLVQNGAGNVFLGDAQSQFPGALVIQNSVNEQLIRSQTTISTTVNSLSLLKSIYVGDSLRDALSNVVGLK